MSARPAARRRLRRTVRLAAAALALGALAALAAPTASCSAAEISQTHQPNTTGWAASPGGVGVTTTQTLRSEATGLAAAASGEGSEETGGGRPLFNDQAGLVTGEQAAALESELGRISQERAADVVIVVVDSLGGLSAPDFAADYFDYGPNPADPSVPGFDLDSGYGRGPSRSGVLLLVALESRDIGVSATGDSIDVFTDQRKRAIREDVAEYLGRSEWNQGFAQFARLADRAYADASRFRWEVVALAGGIAGLLGGFAPVTIWRRQLKSVKLAPHARGYLRAESLRLTGRDDVFLGKSTTVVSTSPPGGSGGRSSSHFGSSGIRHSGSFGKF
ncbi:MAG: TPM domain-containing protein [Bifidobacteriaceae bacterium]|nr:TPM domain-containing protein [Bifidobacteriaceae bacterium]